MACERLAHTVLRRDTLERTSFEKAMNCLVQHGTRGVAIVEHCGWRPTLEFRSTVTNHDCSLAAGSSEQGTQEGARPSTPAARAGPHRLLDRPDAPQRKRLYLRSLADGTLPASPRAGV